VHEERKKRSTWLGFMDVSKTYDTCSLEGRVVNENEEVWCRRIVSLCEGL